MMELDGVASARSCLADIHRGDLYFLETALAVMAASGHRVMPVGRSALDGMLAAVESLDDLVHEMEDAGIPWKDCDAVVRIAASLRPSPMGGLEGFRTQIAWLEGLWLDVLDDKNLYVRMPSSTAL